MSRRDPSAESLRSRAQEISESLPKGLSEAKITCPLCKSPARARGLQSEDMPLSEEQKWFVVFTCPRCGLNSTFEAGHFNLENAVNLEAFAWAKRLRGFRENGEQEICPHEEETSPRQMIGIAVFSFVSWIILSGNVSAANLIWGLIVSVVVARLTYRLVAIEVPWRILHPRRWVHLFALAVEFAWQVARQSVSLSIRVLRPSLPIRPGFLAIPTRLEGDFELGLLGSMLSLTPDTLVIDIDQEQGMIYLHWIDVETTNPEEAKEILLGGLEEKILRWLE